MGKHQVNIINVYYLALLDIYMGKDINYNWSGHYFFTGISIVCKQIEISIKTQINNRSRQMKKLNQ